MFHRRSARAQCGSQRQSEHQYVLRESEKKALRQEQYPGSLLPIESSRSRTEKAPQTARLYVSRCFLRTGLELSGSRGGRLLLFFHFLFSQFGQPALKKRAGRPFPFLYREAVEFPNHPAPFRDLILTQRRDVRF